MTGVRRTTLMWCAAGVALATLAACGSKAATPTTSVAYVTGETTTISLDPGLENTLSSLHIEPIEAGGPAKLTASTLTLPITGGDFAIYDAADASPPVQGQFDHAGCTLTIRSGSSTFTLSDLKLDLLRTPVITADVVGPNVSQDDLELFDIDPGLVSAPARGNGTITLASAPVFLAQPAADAFNTSLGVTSITGGLNTGVKIGTVAVVLSSTSGPSTSAPSVSPAPVASTSSS